MYGTVAPLMRRAGAMPAHAVVERGQAGAFAQTRNTVLIIVTCQCLLMQLWSEDESGPLPNSLMNVVAHDGLTTTPRSLMQPLPHAADRQRRSCQAPHGQHAAPDPTLYGQRCVANTMWPTGSAAPARHRMRPTLCGQHYMADRRRRSCFRARVQHFRF